MPLRSWGMQCPRGKSLALAVPLLLGYGARECSLRLCPRLQSTKDRSLHMIEYYFAMERNKVLIHTATWMNLENLMLSERS